jgi:hypothetical protein
MRYDDRFEWWKGTIRLPEFRSLKITMPGRKSTRSTIDLRVEAEDIDPVEEQAAAYSYLLDNQRKVLDACLKGITKTAKQMRPIFEKAGGFEPKRLDELLPKTPTADALRTRVRLYDVCVTDRVKNGIAHIEYSFSSAWDQEHGQLIVLHRDRLVYSGLSGDGW